MNLEKSLIFKYNLSPGGNSSQNIGRAAPSRKGASSLNSTPMINVLLLDRSGVLTSSLPFLLVDCRCGLYESFESEDYGPRGERDSDRRSRGGYSNRISDDVSVSRR